MKTKDELPVCPVATAVSLVGGKWKLLIIRNLRMRSWRFNELQRDLEGISQKVLTDSLRQMMDDVLYTERTRGTGKMAFFLFPLALGYQNSDCSL